MKRVHVCFEKKTRFCIWLCAEKKKNPTTFVVSRGYLSD